MHLKMKYPDIAPCYNNKKIKERTLLQEAERLDD